ncbi:hypothetical protein HGRIS_008925 [Hohenbuehelia grisea]|uniref:Uncharacterized protein n=1 Tax=Hohenbuehelia grisea TaxID=104357 RepID=A0ABR3J018_9AGAR
MAPTTFSSRSCLSADSSITHISVKLPPIRTLNASPPSNPDIALRTSLHARAPLQLLPISQLHLPQHAVCQATASLEKAFRRTSERMQAELSQLRAMCSQAVWNEKRENDDLRAQCAALTQERDIARETMHRIMGRHSLLAASQDGDLSPGAGPRRGTKRRRAEDSHAVTQRPADLPASPVSIASPTSAASDNGKSETDLENMTLMYPSPVEATGCAASRPLEMASTKRSNSAGPVLGGGAALTQNIQVTGIEPAHHAPLEPRTKRRRYSTSSTSSGSSTNTVVEASRLNNRRPTAPSSNGSEARPRPPQRSQLDCVHVDLMYLPAGGRFYCRPCILECEKHATKLNNPSTLPKSFPDDASWEMLRQHCADEHPSECAELASLGPSHIMTLRRRLTMPDPVTAV